MRIVVYPGTFDPIHRGHIDIAERASKLFDQIIFAVAVNSEKNPLFDSDERIELILGATKHITKISQLTEGETYVDPITQPAFGEPDRATKNVILSEGGVVLDDDIAAAIAENVAQESEFNSSTT